MTMAARQDVCADRDGTCERTHRDHKTYRTHGIFCWTKDAGLENQSRSRRPSMVMKKMAEFMDKRYIILHSRPPFLQADTRPALVFQSSVLRTAEDPTRNSTSCGHDVFL